jgi:nucleoside-diphosphate-sugar epimerase
MSSGVLVLGYGAVGQATVKLLMEKGLQVTVAQRRPPQDLPAGVHFKHCDVLDADSVQSCLKGFSQLLIAIGFEYKTPVWQAQWPVAMRNMVDASLHHGLRVVFVDNLYMYGPQVQALHEGMNLTDHPGKPSVRAEITRIWQQAVDQQQLRMTALRAPDFFGPKVLLSQFGEVVFGNLGRGKAAQFLVPIDQPHDFAYVPDMARAIHALLEAPDADFGQVWHMPCAPTRTVRQLMEMGAHSLGKDPKALSFPTWSLPILGMFLPIAKELWEMRFQWDRPYFVNADKFKARFEFVVTPFSESMPATAKSFIQPTKAES